MPLLLILWNIHISQGVWALAHSISQDPGCFPGDVKRIKNTCVRACVCVCGGGAGEILQLQSSNETFLPRTAVTDIELFHFVVVLKFSTQRQTWSNTEKNDTPMTEVTKNVIYMCQLTGVCHVIYMSQLPGACQRGTNWCRSVKT
jgi:hypothetical protein